MNLLQERYPLAFGADREGKVDQARALAKAEAASLELLHGLDLA